MYACMDNTPYMRRNRTSMRRVVQEMADAQKSTKEAAANYTAPDAAVAEQTERCAEEAEELVDHFKKRMLSLLDWRKAQVS